MDIKFKRVSTRLMSRLTELGYKEKVDFIRQFQKEHKLGSRNNIYKILDGVVAPGKNNMLPKMCKTLKLDINEIEDLVNKDRMDIKGWSVLAKTSTPTLRNIAAGAEGLSERDQKDVLTFIRMKAGQR